MYGKVNNYFEEKLYRKMRDRFHVQYTVFLYVGVTVTEIIEQTRGGRSKL
jgi:hypothetical protein